MGKSIYAPGAVGSLTLNGVEIGKVETTIDFAPAIKREIDGKCYGPITATVKIKNPRRFRRRLRRFIRGPWWKRPRPEIYTVKMAPGRTLDDER